MGVLMFSTAVLRAETAELPKSPKEATEMRRARRFKEEKRTRGKALSVTDCWIIKVGWKKMKRHSRYKNGCA